MRDQIVGLLKTINRPGMDKLIDYLIKDTDFFTAPASTKYHGNSEGGLARHSLNVYNLLEEKVKRFYPGDSISDQSVKICGLLHDLCKCDFYYRGIRWYKDDQGKWQQEPSWLINDKLPLGHGEKSVMILQRFIQLTDMEMLAIRWHMGPTPGTLFPPESFSYRQAMNNYPLAVLLSTADIESAYILERENLSTAST